MMSDINSTLAAIFLSCAVGGIIVSVLGLLAMIDFTWFQSDYWANAAEGVCLGGATIAVVSVIISIIFGWFP